MVYQSPGDTVTGDLFVSTIFWNRQECRGAGYQSVLEVLQKQLLVDPSAHAFDPEFLIFEVYTLSKSGLWSRDCQCACEASLGHLGQCIEKAETDAADDNETSL